MSLSLPALAANVDWSIRILDATSGEVLAEETATKRLKTASIGKIFLLIEVARRLEDGRLKAHERIEVLDEFFVEDSGLLYRMSDQNLTIEDAALFVGAFSDNLATNALIHACGLDNVVAVAKGLGYENTTLLDYIRDDRGDPNLPWTSSYGTGAELSDVIRRLGEGDGEAARAAGADADASVITDAVRARVLGWLAANADTSMVASAFLLDPLAHVEREYQGLLLRHKTGAISTARIDVGHLSGPRGSIAYAVGANWDDADEAGLDLRATVESSMAQIGEQIRAWVTGLDRADGRVAPAAPAAPAAPSDGSEGEAAK
ncbi:serine hydrolase [Galactobacter sp.]|uniref:serine hydrolase n=1 Tax=Galactobacter sp. TaxID=2676125 RepID=UPI0025B8D472|nr:serine hydrolase [Galactobacter sp.]